MSLTDPVQVRITRLPTESDIEAFDVTRFEVGKVYHVGPKLGTLLIVLGCAEPEMRSVDRASMGQSTEDER